jgi:hypothetical protein
MTSIIQPWESKSIHSHDILRERKKICVYQ